MARRVFISFHYSRDISRVNIVRNHGVTKGGYTEAGFWDHSLWEETKRRGDEAIKRLINQGLQGTSVTVVLIGRYTAGRKWVDYEIEKSGEKGNGFLGVWINRLGNLDGYTDDRGRNPLDGWDLGPKKLSSIYPTYDWVLDEGYENFGDWVEEAAVIAGR